MSETAGRNRIRRRSVWQVAFPAELTGNIERHHARPPPCKRFCSARSISTPAWPCSSGWCTKRAAAASGGSRCLICEHPPLITVGRSGSRAHLHISSDELTSQQVEVRWLNRGGGCIAHLPGSIGHLSDRAAGEFRLDGRRVSEPAGNRACKHARRIGNPGQRRGRVGRAFGAARGNWPRSAWR